MKTSAASLLSLLFVTVRAAPPGHGFPRFNFGIAAPPAPLIPAAKSYDEIAKLSGPQPKGGAAFPQSPEAERLKPNAAPQSDGFFGRSPESPPLPSGNYEKSAPLFDFNALLEQISPFPSFSFSNSGSGPEKSQLGVASSFEALQQSSVSSGKSQGHKESMQDQAESNGNSTLGKEVYSTKESFGHETSASHAVGASQDFAAQKSESSRHENGHRVQTLSHGTNVQSSPVSRPLTLGAGVLAVNESNSALNDSQALLAPLSQDAFIPAPALNINGEKFSNGSRESSQTNSSNSSAYNIGSNDSKSFAHSESSGDKQAFVNGGANKHATQADRGSESTQLAGSTSTNKFKETSFIGG